MEGIMKIQTITKTFISLLFLLQSAYADTWTESTISTNTTFTRNNGTGDGVWIIDLENDSLEIETGVTLTIEPGVTVLFHDDIRMLVYGTLLAEGTETDSVLFTLNTATGSATEWGGIKLMSHSGDHRISYCRIEYGDADFSGPWVGEYGTNGGGIFVGDTVSNTEITHNLIWKNRATTGGGGIFCFGENQPLIEYNIIRDNSAAQVAGGIGVRGSASSETSKPRIQNNFIMGNTADGIAGGGIGLYANTTAEIYNNLIYNNRSQNGKGGGVAAIFSGSSAILKNNVIRGNSADTDPQVSGSLSLTYSNIEDGFSGEGNISTDPEFTDPANSDFHFEATSSLVDGGDNTDAPAFDYEGTPRPFDGDRDDVATVDIGPYEYVNTAPGITSTPFTDATEDQAYTYQVTADDPDAGEELTFSLVTAPDFLSIDPSTGEISGTPLTDDDAGTHSITVRVADLNDAADTQDYSLDVTAVNDTPVITDIPGQTIEEGETFSTIDLNGYGSDEETSSEELQWSYNGNLELAVDIDAGNIATISIPNTDWYGSETITFTVEDAQGESAGDAAVFTVTNINDAPVVSNVPGETIAEGGTFVTINLDDYVTDIDNAIAEMTWTVSGETNLSVTIDDNRIATVTVPDEDWSGTEILTFTATDPGNLADSDTAIFTVTPVNDAPVVSGIEDQTIDEGDSFLSINLNNFVSDVDNSVEEMEWSYSGNTELTVTISGDDIATIGIPDADWFGSEAITFTATDPGELSGSDEVVFTVTNINDAPVVGNVPGETVAEGTPFATISLDDFVTDMDNTVDQMTWGSSGGTNLSVSIDANNIATVTPLDEDWNGTEILTFTATDPGGLSDSDTAHFTVTPVNDAPVMSGIEDQTIDEGSTFSTVDLSQFTTDVDNDDAELSWGYSGNTELTVDINENGVATITVPDADWFGSETITFTATDPGELSGSDEMVFTVTNINDAPVVGNVPGETVAEGTPFATINLGDFVTDIDNTDDQITWTTSGETNLTVSIGENNTATITPMDENWNGTEIITFTAADPGGLSGSDTAHFTVTPVNDAPVMSGIEDQTIDEGSSFATIDLKEYTTDVDNDHSELSWGYSGNTELTIDIDENGVVSVTVPSEDWLGSEAITFTATDPGELSDSDEVVFTVTNINDAPVVGNVPGETVAEGNAFATINLDDFVEDVDNAIDEMNWSASGEANLTVSIDENRVATITALDEDWNGTEIITFTAADPEGLSDSDTALFRVTPVNDAPVVSGIADQSINEGESFEPIDLKLSVTDVDNEVTELTWSTDGESQLSVMIDENDIATITIPDVEWYGSDTIIFTATDAGGLSDSDTAVFTVDAVNDPPVVSGIMDQEIDEGTLFAQINLDDMVSDVDNNADEMSWSLIDNTDLSLSIDSNRVATIVIPDSNWFGSESLVFMATDPGGLTDTDTAVFTVLNVNDAPVIEEFTLLSIQEGEHFGPLALDDVVEDVDNADAELVWIYDGNESLSVSIDENRVATITPPGENWFGSEVIQFMVSDPGGLRDSIDLQFTIVPVNDAPAFTADLPSLRFSEDDSLHYDPVNWRAFAEDADHPDSLLVFDVIRSNVIEVKYVNDMFRFRAPADWFGRDTLGVAVSDGELSDTTHFFIDVASVNDAPVLHELPDSIVFYNDTSYVMLLDEFVEDVDHPDATLNWSFDTTNDSLVATYDAGNRSLRLSAPGFTGTVDLHLTVSDDSLASAMDTLKVVVDRITAIEDDLYSGIPVTFDMHQNYPNPFNPVTNIRYALPKTSDVVLEVYNVLGQRVATLVNASKPAGYHVAQFDAGRMSSGVYFYRISAVEFNKVMKMIIMK